MNLRPPLSNRGGLEWAESSCPSRWLVFLYKILWASYPWLRHFWLRKCLVSSGLRLGSPLRDFETWVSSPWRADPRRADSWRADPSRGGGRSSCLDFSPLCQMGSLASDRYRLGWPRGERGLRSSLCERIRACSLCSGGLWKLSWVFPCWKAVIISMMVRCRVC